MAAASCSSLKDPILSVADMKRMKLRSPPGDVAKAVGRTGAAVVPTPGVKAFDVVSKGIVDGLVFPIGDVWKLKMTPYVKHLTKVPGKVYGAVFSMYMNQRVWNKLSKEDKAVVTAASGENVSMDSNNWGNVDIEAEAIYRKSGIGIHNASAGFTADLMKLWAYQDEAWIATANKAGVDGRAALDFYRARVEEDLQGQPELGLPPMSGEAGGPEADDVWPDGWFEAVLMGIVAMTVFLMMAITFVDVAGRYLFSAPIRPASS